MRRNCGTRRSRASAELVRNPDLNPHHMHMHTHTHACTHTHIYAHTYMQVCTHTHQHTQYTHRIHMYALTHTHTLTYACLHTRTHTQAHTYINILSSDSALSGSESWKQFFLSTSELSAQSCQESRSFCEHTLYPTPASPAPCSMF